MEKLTWKFIEVKVSIDGKEALTLNFSGKLPTTYSPKTVLKLVLEHLTNN